MRYREWEEIYHLNEYDSIDREIIINNYINPRRVKVLDLFEELNALTQS